MAVWRGDFDNGGLPQEISQGSTVQGNEYGWSLTAFPNAVARAEAHWYAVVGSHSQFRLADGRTCGMYWLEADSEECAEGDSWSDYCHRSCSVVLYIFQHLASATDFEKEGIKLAICSNRPNREQQDNAASVLSFNRSKFCAWSRSWYVG